MKNQDNANTMPAAGKAKSTGCRRCSAIRRLSPSTLEALGLGDFAADVFFTKCTTCGMNWSGLDGMWQSKSDAEIDAAYRRAEDRLRALMVNPPEGVAEAIRKFLPPGFLQRVDQ